jgi:hypothetical protein
MRKRLITGLLAVAVGIACSPSEKASNESDAIGVMVRSDIGERLARYAPTELEADLSGVPEGEVEVLRELVQAARVMDEIFLVQAWQRNPELREAIAGENDDVRTYFRINFGPWDRLDEMEPFVIDMEHPPGAGYYPNDMTAEEFEAWLEEHPGDREAFTSLHTVIRRENDGLVAVPYSEAFGEQLARAAEHLRAAAGLTDNESLRAFLLARAEAFGTDDYYQSDLAWMDLDSPVEVTIGPYETYEDSLFGYKAAFEAFVTVNVPEESERLERFKEFLPWLEENLPIADEHKNERGTESPIRVVDEVFVGGDSKAGVQTLAFNLPNDERVREEKGSKKVMLRNVLRAKFEKILVPIAERVMVAEDIGRISFDAFFSESLHHELSHGLGPGKITVNGRETEVRLELKELYSTLEEAKADVMGVYNILALVEKGEMPEAFRDTLVPTYVAGLFRSARFGLHEAHGRGVVSQFNYLLEKGALEVDSEGRFRAVDERFPRAIEDLLAEMLMLQAVGDYDGTAEFLDTYGVASDALVAAIDRLGGVPVDIRPIYPQAEELAGK